MEDWRRMGRSQSTDAMPLYTLALASLLVLIFYFAREVLLPFALAVLLSFMLAPVAKRLERWKFGRIGSVSVTVVLAFAVIGGVASVVVRQAVDVVDRLPEYQETVIEKIRSLRGPGTGFFSRTAETLETIEKEIARPEPKGSEESAEPQKQAKGAPASQEKPVPVHLVDTTFLPVRILRDLAPLVAPLGMAAIVVVFVVFMLIQREDLRDRLIRLAGTGHVYGTTEALEDAARRVSRYLLMQLIINVIYGFSVGVGLYFLGLPNATLWGLLATLLRFVPYVGPLIAAVMPLTLSLAIFDGWARPLAAAGMFIILELIVNNVLEPWLYGSSTGVSTLGIVATVVFWTWLWGPVGLVLATPLTVCMTVLAKHVPQFGFLNILLADEQPLEPRFRFYQRLLAQDYDEASEVAEEFLKTSTLSELYESIFVPSLALAERDRDAGRLNEAREEFVYESIGGLMEELGERDKQPATEVEAPQAAAVSNDSDTVSRPPLRVLCLAAEDEADRIAGAMFARLLTARGHPADAADSYGLHAETIQRIEEEGAQCVVVSAVTPDRGLFCCRRLCRRLRRRFSDVRIVVGLWHMDGPLVRLREHLIAAGADVVVASLADGVEEIHRLAAESTAEIATRQEPERDGERSRATGPRRANPAKTA